MEKTVGWTHSPPEGNYGWIVAAGSFLVTMMISIPGITFGILLDDMLLVMDTTTATASWTMSILLGLSGVISPLVTISIHTFSCRKTAIIGGLSMSIGLILSSMANNIETLFFTFGVLSGIGFGCNRIVTIVILGQYFNKRYGIAAGMMMAGFSTSRFLFSAVILQIKEKYGFRGTYLIIGGMCMNICVGAALFQPAKWHYILSRNENAAVKPITAKPCITQASFTKEVSELLPQAHSEERDEKSQRIDHDESKETDICLPSGKMAAAAIIVKTNKVCDDTSSSSIVIRTHHNRIVKSIKSALQFSLLRNPAFHIILASQVLFQFVILYSMVFLIPLSLDKGFKPMDAALVQTIKSGAEIVGRIGVPWILRLTNSNNVPTHMFLMIANGVALLAHALARDYVIFTATAGFTGFLSGGIVVQGYHLILITLGEEKLASAIGLCSFMQGTFLFLGGPLLGYIRDVTGSLVNSYLLLAGLQFASGLVWIFRLLTLWRSNRTNTINSNLNKTKRNDYVIA